MVMLKKLIFAPFFLIFLTTLLYFLTPILRSYEFVFSLSVNTLIQLVVISLLVILSSFAFALFATLAMDLKIVLPVGILASLIPFIFMEAAQGIVFMAGLLVSSVIVYIGLENIMRSYLTFNPNSLFGPPIRQFSTLLILIFCIGYFLSVSKVISEKGFQIPDSLIDTALKLTNQESDQTSQQSSISQDQIDLLRKNPALLKQSGLDPSILDTLNSPKSQNAQNNVVKQTIKDQLQTFLKPYLSFLPAVLAVLLFLTLQSLTSIINLFIYPLLWVIFYILEKTGFIKFVMEQRSVKKMVV